MNIVIVITYFTLQEEHNVNYFLLIWHPSGFALWQINQSMNFVNWYFDLRFEYTFRKFATTPTLAQKLQVERCPFTSFQRSHHRCNYSFSSVLQVADVNYFLYSGHCNCLKQHVKELQVPCTHHSSFLNSGFGPLNQFVFHLIIVVFMATFNFQPLLNSSFLNFQNQKLTNLWLNLEN